MGTHIEVYFPHAGERSPAAVRQRLTRAFDLRTHDLVTLGVIRPSAAWHVTSNPRGIVFGDAPLGFSIFVYASVAELHSLLRFETLSQVGGEVSNALRRVFEAVATEFGAGGRFAVAPGGHGGTDSAHDLAIDGADFDQVCERMETTLGPPARSWAELAAAERAWYRSPL